MREDETKQLDVDLTTILRQLAVLEKELHMVDEEINNLQRDIKSGDISNRAAEKVGAKFNAEKESLRSAIRNVLEESIKTTKNIEDTLKKKLDEYK